MNDPIVIVSAARTPMGGFMGDFASLTCAQLAFSLNTFVTNWFLARASAEAFHAALPGSMLAVAVSALAISTLGYSGTILARRHGHITWGPSLRLPCGGRRGLRCSFLRRCLCV